ncbi:MAG TPA: DUF72 domain-containing protein [Bryobacteraceae bacterium]|nr:DUF72 domain-containing protein [Bryobacteraceae bacterium]
MPQLFAGTSGFAYPQWKPRFYPQDVPQKKFLEHYASRLNSCEINYTFRRLPAPATLESWVQATPPGFVFCLKAHMRITHVRRLKDAGEATEMFLKAIDPLRSARRLGPILFQLPPHLKSDANLLAEFLPLLPRDLRFAFEFRHTSWLNQEIYDLLGQYNACLCQAESERLEVPHVITANFVYFRLRKPEYTAEDLAEIEGRCRSLLESGRDLFVFFKHEDTPEGALYAEDLLRRAGHRLTATG